LALVGVDCGWNVTRALSSIHPTMVVAMPTAAKSASQHCVVSSVSTPVSSVRQHSAVSQASQQSDVVIATAAAQHADTKIVTEEG